MLVSEIKKILCLGIVNVVNVILTLLEVVIFIKKYQRFEF